MCNLTAYVSLSNIDICCANIIEFNGLLLCEPFHFDLHVPSSWCQPLMEHYKFLCISLHAFTVHLPFKASPHGAVKLN